MKGWVEWVVGCGLQWRMVTCRAPVGALKKGANSQDTHACCIVWKRILLRQLVHHFKPIQRRGWGNIKCFKTIGQIIFKIQPVCCSTCTDSLLVFWHWGLKSCSILVGIVTYCAGISCRYLAVTLVTWGRALEQSKRRTGQYWSSRKKAGQPTAEGFIPVHPVGHTEVTSIQSQTKVTQPQMSKINIKISHQECCVQSYAYA